MRYREASHEYRTNSNPIFKSTAKMWWCAKIDHQAKGNRWTYRCHLCHFSPSFAFYTRKQAKDGLRGHELQSCPKRVYNDRSQPPPGY